MSLPMNVFACILPVPVAGSVAGMALVGSNTSAERCRAKVQMSALKKVDECVVISQDKADLTFDAWYAFGM
jgi:hypothetical protein